MTTHSPFLISDSETENVKWFKKDESTNNQAKVIPILFNTYGASLTKITKIIFGQEAMIPDLPLEVIKEIEKKDREWREGL